MSGLAALGSWPLNHGETTAAMEAIGVYWKPAYYTLEGLFKEVGLQTGCRSRTCSDAAWCGCDRPWHGASEFRAVATDPGAVRELTRYRKTQVDAQDNEI